MSLLCADWTVDGFASGPIAIIFVISAFTMSFAGFGFALVATPLLALCMPTMTAVALQFPFCVILFAYQAWHYRRFFHWTDVKPVAASALVGLVLGVMLLRQAPDALMKQILGLFIILILLLNIFTSRQPQRRFTGPWWGHLCGLLSGLFVGAYTIGGPTAALYILMVQDDPRRVKAFMAWFFTLQFICITGVYVYTGVVTLQSLETSVRYTPFVLAGTIAGFYTFGRVSAHGYRVFMQLILLGAAAALLWNP